MLDTRLREIIKTDNASFNPFDRYGEPVSGMYRLPLSSERPNGRFECFSANPDAN